MIGQGAGGVPHGNSPGTDLLFGYLCSNERKTASLAEAIYRVSASIRGMNTTCCARGPKNYLDRGKRGEL